MKIFTKISQILEFQQVTYQYKGNESFRKYIILGTNDKNKKLLQKVSNHPVHIINNDRKFSPSSFIPFCSFGEEFIGAKVNKFDIPVCNIFKPRIYYDQLCYETDLQELKDSNKKVLEEQLEKGLALIIDYNEERQIYNSIDAEKSSQRDKTVSIYLHTISRTFQKGLIIHCNF